MRHRKKTIKLGRTSSHREALLASLVVNLIERGRIKTTLPKARAARPLAEKMVTVARQGTLAARRRAISRLRNVAAVNKLFETVAPQFKDRAGGYTRVMKLGKRVSDSSEMVLLEWVTRATIEAPKKETPKKETAKADAEKSAEKKPSTKKSPRKSSKTAEKKSDSEHAE